MPRNKPKYKQSTNILRESQEYSVGNDSPSINGTGKIGYSHVKEWTLKPAIHQLWKDSLQNGKVYL